jgi:hypothetical protein
MFTKSITERCEGWRRGSVASTDEDWDEADQWDAKDCWVLPDGELSAFLDAQQALIAAGYRVRSAEVVKTHAAWTFDVDQEKTLRFDNQRQLLSFLQNVLSGAGLRYQRGDLMVQPLRRGRFIVSIIWRIPAREPARSRAWQREQRRFQKLSQKVP